MENSDLLRHQIIKNLIAPDTEKVADVAVSLWEPMATKIIEIVGEGGFNSLYARSVFITHPTYSWLDTHAPSTSPNHRFMELKTSFERQTSAHASAANSLLLINFTDILAVLIGEHLTMSILRSAWGNDAFEKVDKEFKNE